MTAQTYLLTNTNAVNSIAIQYFSFTDDSNVQHVANLSNFSLSSSYSNGSTLNQVSKTYSTGGYLRKHLLGDSHSRVVHYSTNTGAALTIQNDVGFTFGYPYGVQSGWVASGGNYDGLFVVSVTDDRHLVMSGSPTSSPSLGTSITFSTSTYRLILDDTTTLGPGWAITENGYTPPPTGAPANIISVIDSANVRVNRLSDTTPTYGNGNGAWIYFTSSTNFLVLTESTSDLIVGMTANGNGYDSSQSITRIVDSNTVIMSDLPNSVPNSGSYITFTDNSPVKSLAPFESATFTVDYTTPTHLRGINYPATVVVHAKEGASNITKTAYNWINISSANTQVPGGSGGPGGANYRSGYTFSVETFTYDDGSTLTIVTNDQTQAFYTITTNATDEGFAPPVGQENSVSDPAAAAAAAAAAAVAAEGAAAAAAAADSGRSAIGESPSTTGVGESTSPSTTGVSGDTGVGTGE